MRNARVQFFCVCAFSVIVNFPQFFEHDIQELHSNHTDINLTFVTVQRTMSQSLWYKTIYKEVLLVWLINYIIPVSSLVYITVKLLQSLRFSRQRRIAMTQGQGQSASHDNRRVNLMVIVVIRGFNDPSVTQFVGQLLDIYHIQSQISTDIMSMLTDC